MLITACAETPSAPYTGQPFAHILFTDPGQGTSNGRTIREADAEYVEVCTDDAGTASFSALHHDGTFGAQSMNYSITATACRDVIVTGRSDVGNSVIDEVTPPSGYAFSHIRVTRVELGGPQIFVGQFNVDNYSIATSASHPSGWLIEYFHTPIIGCTHTIGFWKNHDGSGPQEDLVTALLPIWLGTGSGKSVNVTNTTIAHAIFDRAYDVSGNTGAASSNGISKLYAQLLGAKLSIAQGATGASIASAIAAADAYLATRNQSDWAGLTKAQQAEVNGMASTFDQFNNGVIGPQHCQ